jgi:HD superfamily phosphohydrolase
MSNYGLDNTQRGYEPWKLPKSVLVPGKVLTDPVHGDIYLSKLETAVVDSRPFQRLRRVRQLGNTHLVYPGAVHTRFSHCIGALKVAQGLLDVVWNQSAELHGVKDDLFAEWRQSSGRKAAQKKWAKATVLARLGALLHDLCHVPAGHTVEDDLGVLEAHDENDERFEELWSQMQVDVPLRLAQLGVSGKGIRVTEETLLSKTGHLHKQLRLLVISKGENSLDRKEMKYPFCADLVGNTICADLLDYLSRDHLFTGLPEGLGRRFISAFFVTPNKGGSFGQRLALNIVRDGHERTDIVSELLKALRYRYELSERALVHPAKLAADAMLGESIERWEWALWWVRARGLGQVAEVESRESFEIERVPEYRAELEKEAGEGGSLSEIDAEVREGMEREFRRLGDEGLLDYLAELPGRWDDEQVAPLIETSARLAEDLRDRRLFRVAARVGASDVSPEDVHASFGDPADRAELERAAHSYADLDGDTKVILWIPQPDMRLKLAEVLVRQEIGIAPFVTYERSRSQRGSDIYDAHQRLWAAYVFVHRDVKPKQERMVVAYLAQRMGIRWERHRDVIGGSPDQWPMRLAVADVYGLKLESEIDKRIKRLKPGLRKVAARKQSPDKFEALRQEVEKAKNERDAR